MAPKQKRLTRRKADRALLALVELVECGDVTSGERVRLDQAATLVRSLRDRAAR